MKALVEQAMYHTYSGQQKPVYIIDIGSRRVVILKEDVKTSQHRAHKGGRV